MDAKIGDEVQVVSPHPKTLIGVGKIIQTGPGGRHLAQVESPVNPINAGVYTCVPGEGWYIVSGPAPTPTTRDELCALVNRVGDELRAKQAKAAQEASERWRKREGKRLALESAAPAMRDAIKGLLDWYAALPNPGDVPDGLTLSARLREARKALPDADVVVPGAMGAREE